MKIRDRTSFRVGAGLVATAVVFNVWLVDALLVPGGRIETLFVKQIIMSAQVMLAAAGLYIMAKQPALRGPTRGELTLLAGSTIITLVALEIGSRLWLAHVASPAQQRELLLVTDVAPERFQWTPHHYLNYYPTPNFRRGATSHNSFGYRGPEFPRRKPPGAFRIALLGGSSTYDEFIDDDDDTFAAQLERVLKHKYGHAGVHVINAGAASSTSSPTS